MTLSFSTHIKNEPTYFVEKIINSLDVDQFERLVTTNIQNGAYQSPKYRNIANGFPAKIHTIREDKPDRWRAGNKIHCVLFNRTKDRFQFVPTMKCLSVQPIRILWIDETPVVYLLESEEIGFMPFAYEGYNEAALEVIAKNDGFDSVEAFFNWFSEDFEGKIIHWTDFKYEY